jgi:hypothetical protein
MALKPVQDPNLLAALNAPEQAPAAPLLGGPKPVTDPALLAQLNGPQDIADTVPGSPEEAAAIAANPKPPVSAEPSVWEKFKSGLAADPIVSMWSDALPKVAMGAPEVAMNMIGNTGVQIAGGLGGLMLGQNDEDSANFIRDFTAENSMQPQGDSARELTGALGEAFDPLQNIKSTLGDTTLEATGSPLAATGADMLPDLGLALLGGEGAAARGAELSKRPLKADPVVNPKVADLRAADIRLRPSDVRAMTPGAKKVPGEFRERFADAPELKKDMTLHNQQRMTDIAAKEIGAKDLTDKSIDAAEAPHIAKYQMAEDALLEHKVSDEFANTFREAAASAKLPNGEQLGVTRVIGALRRRAATRGRSNDVKTEEAGYADRELADRLEGQFGKELEAAGEPQLLKEYQDARQALAKIHDVRMTTRADQIDAGKLYQLDQKSEGKRLTGGLKLIADASEYAPNVSKHSLTTAARAGGEIEGSKEGLIKGGIKAVLRKVPGMDVGAERFQNTLGKADESRTSYYGREPDIAPLPGPQQKGLDLREALQLEAPPGEVGAPPRTPRQLGPQTDAFGSEFEFQMPQGEVGVPPPGQMSLQDLLGLGEPLNLQKSPGRVGKPKRSP